MRRVGSYPTFPPLPGVKPGGISLLHLSEGHPWRALPVILALWSPDFPHSQAFALCPRSFGQLTVVIVSTFDPQVKNKLVNETQMPYTNEVRFFKEVFGLTLLEYVQSIKSRRIAVIGIGVNVNAAREDFPPELAATAGSLRLATGRRLVRETLLGNILNLLEIKMLEWDASAGFTAFTAEWEAHDILKGRTIAVDMPGGKILHGKVLGVDERGLLCLQGADGAVATVTAGDVHLHVE